MCSRIEAGISPPSTTRTALKKPFSPASTIAVRSSAAFSMRAERCEAFYCDNGDFITIDVPGALSSAANEINDRGQIVGAYSTLTNRNHASRPTAISGTGASSRRSMSPAPCTPARTASTTPAGSSVTTWTPPEYAMASCGTRRQFHDASIFRAPRALEFNGINDRGQMVGGYDVDADGRSSTGSCWIRASSRPSMLLALHRGPWPIGHQQPRGHRRRLHR